MKAPWWLVVLALLALAHGGGEPQIVAAALGPYRVNVWTAPEPPRVGPLHVTIAVYRPGVRMDTPVADARVTVVVRHEGGRALRAQVPANPAYPHYYEADFELPEPGRWEVTIDIAVDGEQGRFAFPLQVQPPARWSPLRWAGVAVGVLLLGWWLWSGRGEGARGVRKTAPRTGAPGR